MLRTKAGAKCRQSQKTHSIQEYLLRQRLERLCEPAGLEFPKETWPKDGHKEYFLLGLCETEDMKDLTILERLEGWARQRNLLKPDETLFAEQFCPSIFSTAGRAPWGAVSD